MHPNSARLSFSPPTHISPTINSITNRFGGLGEPYQTSLIPKKRKGALKIEGERAKSVFSVFGELWAIQEIHSTLPFDLSRLETTYKHLQLYQLAS